MSKAFDSSNPTSSNPESSTPESSTLATRFLIVMRHAKSDWGDIALSDHDRPLNARGCRDAPRMARWLREIDMVPDLVLSSTSQRTLDTVDLMKKEWGSDVEVAGTSALYLATPEAILRTIQSDGCGAVRLMVLAHNPGITHFVSKLAGQVVDMPTAAIAVFQIKKVDWTELTFGGPAKLIQYMRPKAL